VVEAIPERRSEVISGKYIVQYLCSAGSSAAIVPLIKAIGVGWTFTICECPFGCHSGAELTGGRCGLVAARGRICVLYNALGESYAAVG
jgi:hypothetical protein